MTGILLYITWVIAFLVAFGVAIALLPAGSNYPPPQLLLSSIQTIGGYMRSLNELFPVGELFVLIFYASLVRLTSRVVYPLVLRIIRILTEVRP